PHAPALALERREVERELDHLSGSRDDARREHSAADDERSEAGQLAKDLERTGAAGIHERRAVERLPNGTPVSDAEPHVAARGESQLRRRLLARGDDSEPELLFDLADESAHLHELPVLVDEAPLNERGRIQREIEACGVPRSVELERERALAVALGFGLDGVAPRHEAADRVPARR